MNAEEAVNKVWETLDQDKGYVTKLTQEMVRIPSVNPKFVTNIEQNCESDVQAVVERELLSLDMSIDRWEVFPDRPNVIGNIAGSEERSLLMCGHVDVVPIGEQSVWAVDPFGGEIKDGKLYGRGAIDMKSGLAAAIAAVRAIRNSGIELEGRVAIHSVVDEEAGGFGAMDAVRRGHLAKAAIVTEPTWGEIQPSEGGMMWVRITLKGRQAHAGYRFNEIWPQAHTSERLIPGVNVIELMNRFLSALRDYESIRCRTSYHPLVPPGLNTISPNVIRAGAGIGPDGLPILMTNPSIIPDVAVVDLDFKFLPNENLEDVKAEFDAFVHHFCMQDRWLRENPIEVGWALEGVYFPPMDTPEDHSLVASLATRQSQLGKSPHIKGVEFVSDAGHYAGAGVASMLFGPSGDGLHGYDEFVDIASLDQTTKIIAASIIDWCGVQ